MFKAEVKVHRIGSHNSRSATGTTSIEWNLIWNHTAQGIESVEFEVKPQTLVLLLESFNDDTDQTDSWSEEFSFNKIILDIKYDPETSKNIVKMLANGITPKEIEIWNNEITLLF